MQIVVIGCGIIGAAIAYELSQWPDYQVTVIDRQSPAAGSTGAALGVLMGAISQKKGRNLKMRLESIRQYERWIPELEAATGMTIPCNRRGILSLCYDEQELSRYQTLANLRQQQGWCLELLEPSQLQAAYPYLNLERVIGAVYSPQDLQLDAKTLTLALVAAATQRGVDFQFQTSALEVETNPIATGRHCTQIQTSSGVLAADWLVIAAGLGSTPLTAALEQPVEIRPVLGQAARIRLPQPLGNPALAPMITGEDTHIVPLGGADYWLGATVEFPPEVGELEASPTEWQSVVQRATQFCPAIAQAEIIHTWSGLRPRPEGRPAPIVEPLPGYDNVLLATGHYRNGILLAPATASQIRQLIQGG